MRRGFSPAPGGVLAECKPRTFAPAARTIPLDHRLPSQCQGWQLAWLAAGKPPERSTIAAITGADATDTVRLVLAAPRPTLKTGDSFEVIPPAANWNLHNNTVTDCLQPAVLDSYGSVSSVFRDNLLTRGAATGVKQAVLLRGRFQVIGNQFAGFDEADSSALALQADPGREASRSLVQRNVFSRCTQVVTESPAGLWEATATADNVVSDGAMAPAAAALCQALQSAAGYAARVTPTEWTCEWRVPLATLGVDPATVKALPLNLGLHLTTTDAWLAWQATGGPFYDVGNAGDLRLAR